MKSKIIWSIVIAYTICAYGATICNLPNGGSASIKFTKNTSKNNGDGFDDYMSYVTNWIILKHQMAAGEVQNSAYMEQNTLSSSLAVNDTSMATISITSTTARKTELPLTAVKPGETYLQVRIQDKDCAKLNILVAKRKKYDIGVYFVNNTYFLSNGNPEQSALDITAQLNALFNNQANAFFELKDYGYFEATNIGESVNSKAEWAAIVAQNRDQKVDIAIFLVPDINLPDKFGDDNGDVDELGLSIETNCFIDNTGTMNTICHEVVHCTHKPYITCHDGIKESVMSNNSLTGTRILRSAVQNMDAYYETLKNNN